MSTHKVGAYTLSGAAYDVFHKLYFYGPQRDGDLPSKAGFYELVELELAQTDDSLGDSHNQLVDAGMVLGRTIFGA